MHGRLADAKGFKGPLAFRTEMVHLLREASRRQYPPSPTSGMEVMFISVATELMVDRHEARGR